MQVAPRLLALYCYALLSSAFVFAVVRPRPAGLRRLLPALVVVVSHLLVTPLFWSYEADPLMVTPLAGVLSLSAFKVLAMCIGRGPLEEVELGSSYPTFAALMCLPAIPNTVFKVSGGSKMEGIGSTSQLLTRYLKQIGGAAVVATLTFSSSRWIPVLCRHWLYALGSCMFLGAVLDFMGAIASIIFQIQIAPTFNQPWLSSSFADFWARRWNLATTYMLRVLVYEPVMEGRMIATPQAKKMKDGGTTGKQVASEDMGSNQNTHDVNTHQPHHTVSHRSSPLRQYLALQATFLFSAAWHIYVFWCNTHVISWEWFWFFTIQAPIVVVEKFVIRACKRRGLVLPPFLSIPLANFLLIYIARPLFFGPVDNSGMAERIKAYLHKYIQW